MELAVSMSVGKVAIGHDIRREISANVDVNLMHQNEIFIDKLAPYNYDVVAYTNATFQPVLDEFNQRQTRENRRKDKPYVEYIQAENEKLLQKAEDNKAKGIKTSVRKPTKLVHEYVLQFGNRENNGTTNGADIELNREAARKTLADIQRKYPHADILLATFHADEPNGTPHMHILVQFVGEGYEKGLSRQISMSKALENDGFERCQNRGDYAINRWTKEIQDTIMNDNLKEFFRADREVLNEKRSHDETPFFRVKAIREAEELAKERRKTAQVKEAAAQQLAVAIDVSRKLTDPKRTEAVNVTTSAGTVAYMPIPELERRSEALQQKVEQLQESEKELAEIDRVSKFVAEKDDIKVYAAEIPDGLLRKKRVVVVESDLAAEEIKRVFKANDLVEGATEQANAVLAAADQEIQSAQKVLSEKDEILRSADVERKGILAAAKEKAAEIIKDAQEKLKELKDEIASLFGKRDKLNEECFMLNHQKKSLETELEKLKPLKEEHDALKAEHESLARLVGNAYSESYFKPWSEMNRYASYEDYRKTGELLALYNDGTIRQVGKNDRGGFDDKTLQDQRAGLCRVGIMQKERSVRVPESLLHELMENRDERIPVTQRLTKFMVDEYTVQSKGKNKERVR